jgi:hypothetical protein
MLADVSDFRAQQVEVIEQPFIGRQNSPIGCHGGNHQPMGFEQDRFVLLQAAEQKIRNGALRDLMPTGQGLCVLF